MYCSMTLTVEHVTPAIAEKWLSLNSANRRIRDRIVAQYARDMRLGQWLDKPVAICFDEHNRLGNGQHTLSAIVKSGEPQDLLVARDVPRKAIAFMDMGLRRSIEDVGQFVGVEFKSRKAAIARIVAFGPADTQSRSFTELFDAYQAHADAIDFAEAVSPRQAGFSAAAVAVLASAAYTQNRDRIARFAEVVRTGVGDGEYESAAIRFRDFARSLRGASSVDLRLETFRKCQSALYHFLHGKPMSKLYGTVETLFPVPAVDDRQREQYRELVGA